MIVTVILTCLAMTVSTIPVTPDTGLAQQQTHNNIPAQNLPPTTVQLEASSQKPAPQILVQIQPNVQQPPPPPLQPLQPGVIQQQGIGLPQGGPPPQFLLPLPPHHQPWVPTQHGGVQLMMPYQPNFQGPPPHVNMPTTMQQQQQQQQQPMMFSPYGYYPVFSPPQGGNQLYNPYGFPMIFQSPPQQVPQSPPMNQPAVVSPVAPPAETPSGPTGAAAANTHQPAPERQQNHHQILYMFQQPMTSQFGGLSSEELEVAARLSMFLPSAAAAAAVNMPSLGVHAAGQLLPSEAGGTPQEPAQPIPADILGALPGGNNVAPVGLVESSGQNPASLPGLPAAVLRPETNHQTNGRRSSSSSSSRPSTLFEATPPPLANNPLPPGTTTSTAMEVNDIYHP